MYNNISDRVYCITIHRTGTEKPVLFNDKIMTSKDTGRALEELNKLGFANLERVTLSYAINNGLLTL